MKRLNDDRGGLNLPTGYVPSTFLFAFVAGDIVGRTSIRHELNEFLRNVGGHIGYSVVPEYRRKGFATEILRQSLLIAKSLGIDRILVTCDENNVGSMRTIEKTAEFLRTSIPAQKYRYL